VTAPPPDRARLLGIEGVRGLAASSIVVYHVWLYSGPGGRSASFGPATKVFENLLAGVTLFFVLSGFLLFRPYVAAALRGTPTPSLRGFLRNRALRIVPAYWAILAFVALAFDRQLLEHPEQLAANAFLLQDYVSSYIFGPGIVPAWSLAIEVVFYLTVPVLGAIAIRSARRSGRPVLGASIPVAALVVLGIGSKVLQHALGLGDVWGLSFPAHADWFAPGMGLAVLRVLWEDGRLRLPPLWRTGCVVLAAALTVVSLKLFYTGPLNGLEYQSPIAWACALLLATIVLAPPTSRAVRLLTLRPFVAVGLASYSLYLWHDPIVRALRDAGLTAGGRPGMLLNLLVVSTLAGIASALTYRYVEQPALRRKRAWQRPAERAAPPQHEPQPPQPPETARPDVVAA
jgi:peptidoglycan/LPS O-acetylase OafA/YrhL